VENRVWLSHTVDRALSTIDRATVGLSQYVGKYIYVKSHN